MAYSPNFSDPRVIKRINLALEYVRQYIKPNENTWQSTRHIDDHFSQGQLPLSKWLRSKLLIVVDNHYNYLTGKCKTYSRNEDGYQELKSLMSSKPQQPQITSSEHEQLITGQFIYDHQANRLFNTIQSKPKYIKRPLLSSYGYNHTYDIICAAPRLILQYARKCGLDTPTPLLDQYLADRQQVRQQLAQDIGITTDQVKEIINALINGAVITHRSDTSILKILNNKHLLIDSLKQNQYITKLRVEIKSVWQSIKPHRPLRTMINKNGVTVNMRLTPRDKSDVYRELEELVLREIQRYLVRTNNRGLLEHDGWTCCDVVDTTELRSLVRSNTGYVIELEWSINE